MFGFLKRGRSKAHHIDIQQEIEYLNSFAGTWPAKFENASQEKKLYRHWKRVVRDAQKAYEHAETEETLCNLADLFRIGHNMGVENSGQNAMQGLSRCLEMYPNSFRGNLIASYFFLSIDRTFAPQGEACLRKLQELSGDTPCEVAERGLVFAYLYQNQYEQALKQAEFYTATFGEDNTVLAVMQGLKEGTLDIVESTGL